MVAAPLMTSGISLNLPKVGGKAFEGKETSINISVDKEGRYYIGKTEIEADKVVAKVKAIKRENDEATISISGDTESAYGRVINISGPLPKVQDARSSRVKTTTMSTSIAFLPKSMRISTRCGTRFC